MKNGFFRAAAVVPEVFVANPAANTMAVIGHINDLEKSGVDLAVFPELCITGYTCGDLFHSQMLVGQTVDSLKKIAAATEGLHITAIVGCHICFANRIYNCGAAIHAGKIQAIVPKTYLPNYNEFYEKRAFVSGFGIEGTVLDAPFTSHQLIDVAGVKVAIEICEDLWTPIPPSCRAAMNGAEVIANLSASDDVIGKYDYLCNLVRQQSARCKAAYVYASAGFGESSTDVVFDGKAIIAECGNIIAINERWQTKAQVVISDIDIDAIRYDRLHQSSYGDCAVCETTKPYSTAETIPTCNEASDRNWKLMRQVNPAPFIPAGVHDLSRQYAEITGIQMSGLARRLVATKCSTLIIGISGGLDSTLALLVAAKTFDRLGLDRKGIIGVTMPGFGTTNRTHSNAVTLMKELGVTMREISIVPAVNQHFSDIGQDKDVHDAAYENSQARERTQILMDLANKEGGMVLGTGDLSELALGWATYNGDHMSMYGINASVPKTLVSQLVKWYAAQSENKVVSQALLDIVETPISPELTPAGKDGDIAQKTENLVGPYELHDFFLYYAIRYGFSPRRIFLLACEAFNAADGEKYSKDVIKHWLAVFFRRFFSQQFKRSCMPDGPKVGAVSLSPRGDWRMPSDASSAAWLQEIESL